MKKVIIKLAARFMFNEDRYTIQKLENGYVFHDKYYKDLDSMKDDLIESLKEFFK